MQRGLDEVRVEIALARGAPLTVEVVADRARIDTNAAEGILLSMEARGLVRVHGRAVTVLSQGLAQIAPLRPRLNVDALTTPPGSRCRACGRVIAEGGFHETPAGRYCAPCGPHRGRATW